MGFIEFCISQFLRRLFPTAIENGEKKSDTFDLLCEWTNSIMTSIAIIRLCEENKIFILRTSDTFGFVRLMKIEMIKLTIFEWAVEICIILWKWTAHDCHIELSYIYRKPRKCREILRFLSECMLSTVTIWDDGKFVENKAKNQKKEFASCFLCTTTGCRLSWNDSRKLFGQKRKHFHLTTDEIQ